MEEKYFDILIKMANKAAKKGEVPVSALIVENGKIIAKAYNSRIKDDNPLSHAEIKCIVKAAKKNKDWRLNGKDLYVTLEPCHMCKEIINECRINNVYYLLKKSKEITYKTNYKNVLVNSKKYENTLKNFFEKLR